MTVFTLFSPFNKSILPPPVTGATERGRQHW